jgi:hypothetical protein
MKNNNGSFNLFSNLTGKNLVLNNIEIIYRPEDGYINATKLCQAGDKRYNNWYQNDKTKRFLEVLSSTTGIPAVELLKQEQGGNGERHTWVHPQVAINIAQWISPEFDVQVSKWIYELCITGNVSLDSKTTTQELDSILKEKYEKQLQEINRLQEIENKYKYELDILKTKENELVEELEQYKNQNMKYTNNIQSCKDRERELLIILENTQNKLLSVKEEYENEINNKPLDKTITTILDDNNKPYLTVKNPHYQPSNNCLLGLDSYYYFEGNPHSYIKNFIKMIKMTIKKYKNVPDCDLLLNRKDFAYLRKDNKYNYTYLLPNESIKNIKKYWIVGSQSKKKINLDVPIPSSDEFDTINTFIQYNTKWNDKIEKAVFRGSSTGCGTNDFNNIRLKLCQKFINNVLFDVKLSKLVKRIKAYKENIYIINNEKYKHLLGSFMDGKEQSKYKYIFNVEGNAQAYRYSTEFKKKSVVLNIKSDYYMWFEPLLVNKKHFIEIDNQLNDSHFYPI